MGLLYSGGWVWGLCFRVGFVGVGRGVLVRGWSGVWGGFLFGVRGGGGRWGGGGLFFVWGGFRGGWVGGVVVWEGISWVWGGCGV